MLNDRVLRVFTGRLWAKVDDFIIVPAIFALNLITRYWTDPVTSKLTHDLGEQLLVIILLLGHLLEVHHAVHAVTNDSLIRCFGVRVDGQLRGGLEIDSEPADTPFLPIADTNLIFEVIHGSFDYRIHFNRLRIRW